MNTTCVVCGEELPAGARTCPLCGAGVAAVPTATKGPPRTTMPSLPHSQPLSADARVCPACGKVYGPEYDDSFCTCGMELIRPEQVAAPLIPAEPAAPPAPVEERQSTIPPARAVRPPPGTTCLVLYGSDRKPMYYFPVEKDAVLIGRLDAVEGNFPDIDLAACLEPAAARKVSRKHAIILRSRATGAYTLRPLAGNTGTQLDADMVVPMGDYPLSPGQRLILGGVARFKFEVM